MWPGSEVLFLPFWAFLFTCEVVRERGTMITMKHEQLPKRKGVMLPEKRVQIRIRITAVNTARTYDMLESPLCTYDVY